jgi:hypothetical protein
METEQLNDGICKCGHHSKDHSYNTLTDELECDLCDCGEYVFDCFD